MRAARMTCLGCDSGQRNTCDDITCNQQRQRIRLKPGRHKDWPILVCPYSAWDGVKETEETFSRAPCILSFTCTGITRGVEIKINTRNQIFLSGRVSPLQGLSQLPNLTSRQTLIALKYGLCIDKVHRGFFCHEAVREAMIRKSNFTSLDLVFPHQ